MLGMMGQENFGHTAYALMQSEVEHAFPSTSPKAMIMLRPPRLVGAEAANSSTAACARHHP